MALSAQHAFAALRKCLVGMAELVAPDVCAACGAADAQTDHLCAGCKVDLLTLVSLPYCLRCGATLGPNVPARPDGCWACPTTLGRFGRLVRLGPYAPPLSGLIRQFKYRRGDVIAGRLADLLAEALRSRSEAAFDVAMPVPMHWLRKMTRGFDHAASLARAVAHRLGLPIGCELIRIRNTPPQTHLSRTKRLANVRGAFKASSSSALEGARVLLIDDVTTTGATADEAARTLLAAGASQVSLAVLAKSEPPTAYAYQHS